MNRLKQACTWAAALLTCTTVAAADSPAYLSRYETSPQDISAIMQLTEDFRTALAAKDVKKLSTFMLNSDILMASPLDPETVKMINDTRDVNFDGVAHGGFIQFANLVLSAHERLEERFYDIKITQDGPVAWVAFNFEFMRDSRVENHGREVWQTVKTSGNKWKIFSIVWSSHHAPKEG
jgi:SnoaL-like domain